MEITIAGHKFELVNERTLNLRYNSVASDFVFQVYFDPYNPVHKEIFKPYTYPSCTVSHKGVLLLTGIVLTHEFVDAGDPPAELITIKGYSLAGCLQECTPVMNNLQLNNLKVIDIVNAMTDYYQKIWGFKVIVDPEVAEIVNTVVPQANPQVTDLIQPYLDKLLSNFNVILSHDQFGNVVLTKVKADKMLTTTRTQLRSDNTSFGEGLEGYNYYNETVETTTESSRAVLYDFTDRTQWLQMTNTCDGQAMHSDVVVQSEYQSENNNNIDSSIAFNPMVQVASKSKNAFDPVPATGTLNRGCRPLTIAQPTQTNQADNSAPRTSRSVLGEELKTNQLRISVKGWELNGHMITPNQMITATNPRVYLYEKTQFFIEAVTLYGNVVDETATILSVPPPAYTTDDIKTIY
jgi:prophage tail gpP-like protein